MIDVSSVPLTCFGVAALALLVVGQATAEPAAPQVPIVRARKIVQRIPPFVPEGQHAQTGGTAPPPSGTTAPNVPNLPLVLPTGPPIAVGLLAWDAERKEKIVTLGTAEVLFNFLVTNVSTEPITITNVRTSCGCTVPKLASMPWTLPPGAQGPIDVTMNLAGKRGVLLKQVIVNTDRGHKIVEVMANIQEPVIASMSEADRVRNLQIATADRQAVFKGDCATCHATPAIAKTGAELYQAACVICHEGEHRAAAVPDLKHLHKITNADYWRTWITTSAEGKLMPAFGKDHGGILDAAQIESLVRYLVETIPQAGPAASTQARVNLTR